MLRFARIFDHSSLMKHIHFIAIGGAAMHSLALDLHRSGYKISGSDDEIYEPSKSRLAAAGILPESTGWFPEKLVDVDAVVLGMHARADNPELRKALQSGIPVYSYPEFVYIQSIHKKRVVIAGSHGKTTTTSMILHVLHKQHIASDYLLGAAVPGFDNMVKLSDAPLIIIEGDEYLSSPIDRRPKIHHYYPHISVLTGIAWDHINVFPDYEDYKDQFRKYIGMIEERGELIYNEEDREVVSLIQELDQNLTLIPYRALNRGAGNNVNHNHKEYPVSVIGRHNLSNMNAARIVCNRLGISDDAFFQSIADFKGASKRLQVLYNDELRTIYLDFAHAPSKVKATCEAVKDCHPERKLLAVLELHTFSSLNRDFIPQYRDTLSKADKCVIFYNAHTLRMKNMPSLDADFVKSSVNHPDCSVFTDKEQLEAFLRNADRDKSDILLMSSGNFDGMDLGFFGEKA